MPVIKKAATFILERCVATEGKGGLITHQGMETKPWCGRTCEPGTNRKADHCNKFLSSSGDNQKVSIAISKYNPINVFCEGAPSAPPVDSCRKLLDTFPITEIRGVKTFGPAGAPGVQEKIPAAFLGGRSLLNMANPSSG